MELIEELHAQRFSRLADVSSLGAPRGWYQTWKSAEDLNLQGNLAAEWSSYISQLNHSAIVIQDQDDELMWTQNKPTGMLTAKLGYEALIEEDLNRERLQWWKLTWQPNCPLKIRTFTWFAHSNKILTWGSCQKRKWNGPNRCILCKADGEIMDHLFVSYPCSKAVWK